MSIIATNESSDKLEMTTLMHKDLEKFFGEKTIVDVDRNTYLTCNLHDSKNKIVISLVFMRDFDGLEINSYSQVVLEGKGAIFIFPPYWLSIPKELTIPYFEYVINDFYSNTVADWIADGNIGNGSGNTSGSTNTGNGCASNSPMCPCGIV